MEIEFTEEHFFLDINWYFADYFNRLCIVASGGGILPKFLNEQDGQNDEFHDIVNNLPEKYSFRRNENILELIVDLKNDDLSQYFVDFDSLAKKGFFVFDKINLSNSGETDYVLVAYPLYDSKKDQYPIDEKNLNLLPKVNRKLILRTNNSFSDENFKIIDLVKILDEGQKK